MTLNKSGLTQFVRLQNSVCLSKVLKTPNVRNYSTQDLSLLDNRSELSQILFDSLGPKEREEIQSQVEIQQTEIVRLAEQLGTYDKKVLDLQLRLVRSKTFRIWAILLMLDKKGSKTPGIDNISLSKPNNEELNYLLNKLRTDTYHPNSYKSSPIKRV